MQYRLLESDVHTQYVTRLQRARRGEDFPNQYDRTTRQAKIDELRHAELEMVAPSGLIDYHNGSAAYPDQVHIADHGTSLLISSEHATHSWRLDTETGNKTTKPCETGTAALGEILARETNSTHLSMIGKQTGNANADHNPDHPHRRDIEHAIASGRYGGFLSIHGMRTGLVPSLDTERPFDLLIGIGYEPNLASIEAASILLHTAAQFGLKAAINQPFLAIVQQEGNFWQCLDDNGTPVTHIFAAPHYTTRALAARSAEQLGLDIPTIQVELAGSLRFVPENIKSQVELGDPSINTIGPFLGYMVLRHAIPLLQSIPHAT